MSVTAIQLFNCIPITRLSPLRCSRSTQLPHHNPTRIVQSRQLTDLDHFQWAICTQWLNTCMKALLPTSKSSQTGLSWHLWLTWARLSSCLHSFKRSHRSLATVMPSLEGINSMHMLVRALFKQKASSKLKKVRFSHASMYCLLQKRRISTLWSWSSNQWTAQLCLASTIRRAWFRVNPERTPTSAAVMAQFVKKLTSQMGEDAH